MNNCLVNISFLVLFILSSCADILSDNEENYIIQDLPQQFPLDKDYAWVYERTYYSNKDLWESELNPDTTFLDTLFVTQTENDFSYYWWGQNPYSVSLVKNQSDENHFIRIGRYYIQLDSIVSFEKPDLWANFNPNFDTTGYSAIYSSFAPTRYSTKDTMQNIIAHSFIEIKNEFHEDYEFYVKSEKNLFGSESWKYYRDYYDDNNEYFGMAKKQSEINNSSTNIGLIKLKIHDRLNRFSKLHDDFRMLQGYSKDAKKIAGKYENDLMQKIFDEDY